MTSRIVVIGIERGLFLATLFTAVTTKHGLVLIIIVMLVFIKVRLRHFDDFLRNGVVGNNEFFSTKNRRCSC